MSSNLMWEPAKRKAKSLPDALKIVLRDKGGLDGGRKIYSRDDLQYLTGLAHAEIDGASELIELIEKHEIVELWLEY